MPSRSEHLAKAENNKGFADAIKLSNPTSVGWALTALFYSALHYVEAFNGKYNLHCKSHHQLKADIAKNPQLLTIFDEYSGLLDYSWNARYEVAVYGKREFDEASEYHAAIKKHILDLFLAGK
jgi:hypothetical protein